MTDLPEFSRNRYSILVVVNNETRMVHLAPCNKGINVTNIARRLWNTVVKLHSVPRVIYSDRGSQFTIESWRELWRLTGTKLAYSTAYHPQTQEVVEHMNSIIEQCMKCTIHEFGNIKEWEKSSFYCRVNYQLVTQ